MTSWKGKQKTTSLNKIIVVGIFIWTAYSYLISHLMISRTTSTVTSLCVLPETELISFVNFVIFFSKIIEDVGSTSRRDCCISFIQFMKYFYARIKTFVCLPWPTSRPLLFAKAEYWLMVTIFVWLLPNNDRLLRKDEMNVLIFFRVKCLTMHRWQIFFTLLILRKQSSRSR